MTTNTQTQTRDQRDAELYATFVMSGRKFTAAAKAAGVPRTSLRDAVTRHEARMESSAPAAAPAPAPEPELEVTSEPETTDPATQPTARKRTRKNTKTPTAPTACACGCGTATARTFVRGHDSRLLAKLRAAYAGHVMTRDEVLEAATAISARFLGKVTKSVNRLDAGSTVAPVADRDCACGCGGKTARTFVRGHDSRLAKQLRAAYVANEMTRDAVLARAGEISDRFHGKLTRSLANADSVAAAKAEAESGKAA